ncbi:MAG: cytochrome-c oxidase, cbb3-type subunit III [Hyphomicrobium sp.]|uniref:cytochrome-c oxidase, cbb3-type subunit III n=1 Tax=Hyphomicrobium sp. TaxID=82 RepID=UPI0035653650
MSVEERDAHTGYLTTGHEWNGIKELNTPVPRAVYFFLILAFLFGVGYWILMPTWPTGTSYTKGLLGFDQRIFVTEDVKQAAAERAAWTDRIEKESFADIQKDPRLMHDVRETGKALFGDNCAACHGRQATGGKGFPNLTTNSWLWGGSPEQIAETIKVGINSTHPESRTSQMPAFGRDGILQRNDIEKVVAYLRSLSGASGAQAGDVTAGQKIFADNCASCHGEDAKGNSETGAPNLTDRFWIYGGDPQTIYTTVWGGRQGHMPTWEARLSPVERKILAIYTADLRKPDQK